MPKNFANTLMFPLGFQSTGNGVAKDVIHVPVDYPKYVHWVLQSSSGDMTAMGFLLFLVG